MILFVATCCFGISACSLFLYEYKAHRKRDELEEAVQFVKTPFSKSQAVSESVALGTAATGISLFEIYMAHDKHSELLGVVEQRYNRTMGPDSSPWQWFQKVEELQASRGIGNYVSNYVGQAGENAAVEFFQKNGLDAELFESRIHPNDDIRVQLGDGTTVDYSSKSLASVSNFDKAVSEHPDSAHYIVNSELYEKLESSGKLSEYNANGIEIIDGQFSHAEHVSEATEAFEEIADAGDLADNIPWISVAFFGYRTINNIRECVRHNQSKHELGVNVTGDVVRIGTMGVGATIGGKVGSLIGTSVAAGPGTIIGAIVGAIAGGIAGSSLVRRAKEKIKWGKIIESLDYFGRVYDRGLPAPIKENIKKQILQKEQLERQYSEEHQLASQYEDILDPYDFSAKPTMPALLTHTAKINYEAQLLAIEQAINRLEYKLRYLCNAISEKIGNDDEQVKRRYLGELIVNNYELLFNNCETILSKRHLRYYQQQIEKAPNHPYRFASSPQDILRQIVHESYSESYVPPSIMFRKKEGVRVAIFLLFISFVSMAVWLILNLR